MATVEQALGRRKVARPEDVRVRDLLLAALTLSTGCVDAISWLGLGKVFSAFMTGNFVFLGFRIGGAAGPSGPRLGVATAAVGGGGGVGARNLGRPRGPPAIRARPCCTALGVASAC